MITTLCIMVKYLVLSSKRDNAGSLPDYINKPINGIFDLESGNLIS
jgi:hypothetical protein